MSAIMNYFMSSYNNYEALQKKDDDLYVRALESWNAKYQIHNVDSEKKVELMVTELLKIPTQILTISEINAIGDVFHGVALKKRQYKELLIEMIGRSSSDSVVNTWLNRVYTALPMKR